MSFAKKINAPEQPLRISLKELLDSSKGNQNVVTQLEHLKEQNREITLVE